MGKTHATSTERCLLSGNCGSRAKGKESGHRSVCKAHRKDSKEEGSEKVKGGRRDGEETQKGDIDKRTGWVWGPGEEEGPSTSDAGSRRGQ